MRLMQARELFRQFTQEYFSGAVVVLSNQGRMPKPSQPLVVISAGDLNRPQNPNLSVLGEELAGYYLSTVSFTVDLFTNGSPVFDEESDQIVAYEDSALEDILSFADFIGSEYAIEWSHLHDVALSVNGSARNLTGVVNDTSYQYRARIEVLSSFTQLAAGYAGLYSGILYPTGDPEKPYTSEEPIERESPTNGYETDYIKKIAGAIIDKSFSQSSSGGGNEKLAETHTGHFTDAEIQEEKLDE